jgi:CheY-like chemotaxis protein
VLVAEDDDEMRQILRESLEDVGYRVAEVADGIDLHRRLINPLAPRHHGTPDIVVSDIRLPGFTGIEILEQLRQSDWLLPVVLITAFGDDETHQEAKRLGAALVLDKPFDVEDLVEAVCALAPP